jgi:hypothetical protein
MKWKNKIERIIMYKTVPFASLDINQVFYMNTNNRRVPACKVLAAHAQTLVEVHKDDTCYYEPLDFIPMNSTEMVEVSRYKKEFFIRNNIRVLRRKWYKELPKGCKEMKEVPSV